VPRLGGICRISTSFIASAVLIDHLVFFVAIDPYTTLTSIAYVAFVATSLCILVVNDRTEATVVGARLNEGPGHR
jgi:hypothetical protein